ncbi:MAG: acetylglutamate kinase, partial [Sediminibacterium sp.]|nr:acetylglutamate kinase [Sediminibacterium sp.]
MIVKKETLYIIKIGGEIIDSENDLPNFLDQFSSIKDKKILIHGGGKLATNIANQLNIKQTMIDGRRITDSNTLDIVTMVYAGLINKKIVSLLQAKNVDSIGLCGADANLIQAKKRENRGLDYGFVGDI